MVLCGALPLLSGLGSDNCIYEDQPYILAYCRCGPRHFVFDCLSGDLDAAFAYIIGGTIQQPGKYGPLFGSRNCGRKHFLYGRNAGLLLRDRHYGACRKHFDTHGQTRDANRPERRPGISPDQPALRALCGSAHRFRAFFVFSSAHFSQRFFTNSTGFPGEK